MLRIGANLIYITLYLSSKKQLLMLLKMILGLNLYANKMKEKTRQESLIVGTKGNISIKLCQILHGYST